MAINKLYSLINTLDKQEIRQIRKLLRSPFFTRREDLPLLFACLSAYQWDNKPLPPREEVYKQCFPELEYNDLRLRGSMSDLMALIEEYLLIAHHRQSAVDNRLLLADLYRRRGLSKHFGRCMKKAHQLLDQNKARSIDHYSKLQEYQVLQMQFQTQTQRTGQLNLQEISDTMDAHYLMKKLRYACTQLTHQAVYKTSYNYGLLPRLLEDIESGGYLSYPAVATYYYCYRFLTEQYSLDYFQQFRNQLQENRQLFPEEEQKDLYILAINFCIRQMNAGSQPFARQVWELYQEGLEVGFLLEDGRLSHFTFNNVVAISIHLEEYVWLEHFIEAYKDRIESTYRKSTVSFNRARLEYARGNYQKAMLLLQTSEYKDLVNNLISKNILLKIYYELEEFDLLESHLDSLNSFIRRREVSDYHRSNYLNVIRLVRKLVALESFDKSKLEKLRQEIESTEILSDREWLLEQCNLK